jgi:hypothetical protein
MKRIIVLACALALVPIASAQMYKYIDKNGKTVYTDQPPPDVDSKNMRIPSSAIGNAAPATKSAVAQDKENQKGKEKVAEGAKKEEEKAAYAKAEAERCESAKAAYQQYAMGGRIAKLNEKGEKIFLGDSEIDAARERAKSQVDQYCKGQ